MNEKMRACIAGVGETEYTRRGGIQEKTEFQLACQAIESACVDAGIEVHELDGFSTFAENRIEGALLQLALGMKQLRFSSSVWGGRGGGGCGALGHAAMAVESGRARHVVVFRSIAQGQSRRYGKFDAQRPLGNMGAPFGLFSAPQMIALVLQRYAHSHRLSEKAMAEIAIAARENALRNPRAILRDRPLDMETYLSSKMIAEPLRVPDCCLESDGACAVVVTTAERARDLNKKPVNILAATECGESAWGVGPLGSHNMPSSTYATGGQKDLAAELFARAGVSASEIDVAQIYDHFTGMVLIALEDFGFCEAGESSDFVESGGIRWNSGRLPMNTAGGSLAEAYVHGLNHVIEGVRQLRGESSSQVMNAETCFVSSASAISPSSAAILAI